MGLKTVLAHPFERVEDGIDRAVSRWRRRHGDPPVIEAYLGYATPDSFVLRGRILSKLRPDRTVSETQRRWRNAAQMIALFLTSEVSGVRLRAVDSGAETTSDEEGYFTLAVPRDDRTGHFGITVEAEGAVAVLPVLVPAGPSDFGVVSDIDDTVMLTRAWNVWRNLWTTLTGNMLTRKIFDDSVALLARLSDGGRNPVFYVSSSPWNMHGFLDKVFDRAGLVQGPKFLRDLGISRRLRRANSHAAHKGGVIDRLMAAHPGLPFVLIGDTGQHDARFYADAAERHPGRVLRVILRHAAREPDPAALARLTALGVPVFTGPDLRRAIPEPGA